VIPLRSILQAAIYLMTIHLRMVRLPLPFCRRSRRGSFDAAPSTNARAQNRICSQPRAENPPPRGRTSAHAAPAAAAEKTRKAHHGSEMRVSSTSRPSPLDPSGRRSEIFLRRVCLRARFGRLHRGRDWAPEPIGTGAHRQRPGDFGVLGLPAKISLVDTTMAQPAAIAPLGSSPLGDDVTAEARDGESKLVFEPLY